MNKYFKYSIIYSLLIFAISWLTFFWFRIYFIMKSGMAKSMSGVNYWSVIPIEHLIYFLFGQIFAYGILVLINYLVLSGANNILFKRMKYPLLGVHFILLSVFFSVILLSQFLFPITRHPIEIEVSFTNFSLSSVAFLIPVILVVVFLAAGIMNVGSNFRRVVVGIICIFLMDTLVSVISQKNVKEKSNLQGVTATKNPNLIIIGIDSYDYSKIKKHEERQGFIGNFVNNSVLFEDTLTPLARTYVAWMSVLTANYPVNSGVRYNLFPRDFGKQSSTLMPYLQTLGYQTIYSTDERRFANLDAYHGFEKVIGPPAGAADFLLGSASDMPVTNIFMSTSLGQRFFPYSYANRAVAYSYDYQDFIDLYEKELHQVPNDKPVFLATHLCLAHWPYYDKHSDLENKNKPFVIYSQKIKEVNQMAETIYNKIEKAGLLKNAVVVLLSDHGEGWPEKYASKVKPSSYGHGTNLLDEDQQRVLFAVQRYVDGKPMINPKQLSYPASLIDVLPTMFGVAEISIPENINGYNLNSLIENKDSNLPFERPRLLETEIHVSAIDSVDDGNIDETAVATETASNYRITSDGRFELRHQSVENFLHFKERAIELNGQYLHWNSYTGFKVYNSKNYEIRPYDASQENDQKLMKQFCDLFGKDIKKGYVPEKDCNYSKSLIATP